MIRTCVQCGREFEAKRSELLCSDECRRERQKARAKGHYAKNRESAKSRTKAWRKANPERFRAQCEAWRKANRARLNAENKVYREKNAERLHAQQKQRRRLQRLKAASTAPAVGDDDVR
jgi:hypothetical protein